MGITIRPATIDDAEAVLALWNALDEESRAWLPPAWADDVGRWTPAIFRAALRDRGAWVGVAEVDGAVAGAIYAVTGEVRLDPLSAGHPVCDIARLYVDPARRRQGVGRALVEAVRAWAAAQQVAAVRVAVWTANAPAAQFYAALGLRAPLEWRWQWL